MRRTFLILVVLLNCLIAVAQNDKTWERTIYCNNYNIYIVMNFYDKDVTIPGQEFMGKMDGYLGDYEDFRRWLILDSEFIDDNTVEMAMINLEGSEDLKATLTHNPDDTYTLKQGKGSTLKIARRQKWVKLPKNITFTTVRVK